MTQREVVLQYFREAELTSSAIDSLMRLPKGRSHEFIVGWWQEQKKPRRKSRTWSPRSSRSRG